MTELSNILTISAILKVDDKVFIKYLQKKLACNIIVMKQAAGVKRVMVNGHIVANVIDELVESFILKYVLCKQCNNPETENDRCNACGCRQSTYAQEPIQVVADTDDGVDFGGTSDVIHDSSF
jgi:translation initiation factor 2 beta subunit (eIF-2beta)/eIF-5